jgi:hypothetical protein
MIKIGKMPRILEDADRWTVGTGTFYVEKIVGFVQEDFWKELQQFEQYSLTEAGKAEMESAAAQVRAGNFRSETIDIPIMNRLLGRSKSITWQFNMLLDDTHEVGLEPQYIRSYATFDKITLVPWSDLMDREVEALEAKCLKMNDARTPRND